MNILIYFYEPFQVACTQAGYLNAFSSSVGVQKGVSTVLTCPLTYAQMANEDLAGVTKNARYFMIMIFAMYGFFFFHQPWVRQAMMP